MKKIFDSWIVEEWSNHKARFLIETVATILIVGALTYLAAKGNDAKASYLLWGNFLGGILFTISAVSRKSITFLITDAVCVIVAFIGLMRL